jgi:hypothetical protein
MARPFGRSFGVAWAFVVAARRLGLDPETYAERRAAGYRWCYRCRRWRPAQRFGSDRCRRASGRDGTCTECRIEIDATRSR